MTMSKVDSVIAQARLAAAEFALFPSQKIDGIFRDVAMAANQHHIRLARLAVNETKRGVFEDKVIKNLFAGENVYHAFKSWRPRVSSNLLQNQPYGVIAALLPGTNPTSTAIYKTLLAIRSSNGIVLIPHPSASLCTAETMRILSAACDKAGAPKGLVGLLEHSTREEVMQLCEVADLVWATGGADMVEACSKTRAKTPCLLGGPGNCAALIDETCNVQQAVASIMMSKTFDNGMICAAEQAIVVVEAVLQQVKSALREQGALLLSTEDTARLGKLMRKDGGTTINKHLVGQSVSIITALAGITAPSDTRLLVGEALSSQIGSAYPWSCEKMAPILALYVAASFKEAVDISRRLVLNGGEGHVAALHTAALGGDNDRVRCFAAAVPAGEVVVNVPSSQGAIGDLYNFCSVPRLSIQTRLPAGGGSPEITPDALRQVREVVFRMEHYLCVRLPGVVLFGEGSANKALKMAIEAAEGKSLMIVSEAQSDDLGLVQKFERLAVELGVPHVVRFCDVKPELGFKTILSGLDLMRQTNPSTVLVIGSGAVLDVAKMMRFMLDHPTAIDLNGFEPHSQDMDNKIPPLWRDACSRVKKGHTQLVCLPTSNGTGSEVSHAVVISDMLSGAKFSLADYALTPNICAVDPSLIATLSPDLVGSSGMLAISHAIESHVSMYSSHATRPWSTQALVLLFANLKASQQGNLLARNLVQEGSCIAGMASANASLGVVQSLALQFGSKYGIAQGVSCAIALPHVIAFNANLKGKQGYFSNHVSPYVTRLRLVELASCIGVPLDTKDDAMIAGLTGRLGVLCGELGVPVRISDACGVSSVAFEQDIAAMAVGAFDDQCVLGIN